MMLGKHQELLLMDLIRKGMMHLGKFLCGLLVSKSLTFRDGFGGDPLNSGKPMKRYANFTYLCMFC